MISSPCKNCPRRDLPKEDCAKNCKLLKAIQHIHVSTERWNVGSGIDYTEEYSYTAPSPISESSVSLWSI
jgi:hypothetical protein